MSDLSARIAAFKTMTKDLVEVLDQNKSAFMTMPPMPQPGAPQPPMDPAMMAQQGAPMDPAMMQGMDPAMMAQQGMDPAMMAQQGMDPAMMQGMDPAMMQGMDPAMMQGGDPNAQQQPPAMGPDELAAAVDEVMGLLESEIAPAIAEIDQRVSQLEQSTQEAIEELSERTTANEKMLERLLTQQEVTAQGGWGQ